MKAIVVDDERLARSELKSMLADYGNIEITGEAANADEAKKLIKKEKPDVIFLDIQMPEKTGFDLLTELNACPHVIFVSAYDEYALKAFEVNALDYLLKPVDPERLSETIQKLEKKVENNDTPTEDHLSVNDQIFIKDGEKCWFVELSKIRMFESEGNYVRVYFENHKPLILRSLNALEEKLDNKIFFRANRKYIINLKWITKIDNWFNGGLIVNLKDEDEKVEISRRQAIKFKELMSL